jgi:hypothetical protein
MSWSLLSPLFKKSSGKTVKAVYIKKAVDKSPAIFRPKRYGLSSQDCEQGQYPGPRFRLSPAVQIEGKEAS